MAQRDLAHIRQMYDSGLTAREIAPVVGVSPRTIVRDLHKSGASVRNPGGEHPEKLDDVEWLRSIYEAGHSTTEIAEMVGCTASRVSHWLRRHGIDTRSPGAEKGHKRNTAAARLKMSKAKRGKRLGAANPNWKGGISPDPERNRYRAKMWSKQVKERDSFTCRECGSGDSLHSHHIKRWRDYPELRYDLDNGITLCIDCHEKAHGGKFRFRNRRHAESDTSALPLQKAG